MVAAWEQVTEGWRTRTIVQTGLVTIGECRCIAGSPAGVSEYITGGFECVFPRRGLFSKETEGRSILADPNWAVIFTPGELVSTRRMFGFGFDCRWVRISEPFLEALAAQTGGAGADRIRGGGEAAGGPGPLMGAPSIRCPARDFLMQRLFAAAGEDDLARIEEAAIELVRGLLGRARPAVLRERVTTATARRYAEQADAAKIVIAERYRERLTITDLARAVHASPFHLCRIFRAQTGLPLHRYLMNVRLRSALEEMMEEPRDQDISALALRTGFSSHSHFTCAFRREFGIAPSTLRQSRSLARIGLNANPA